MADVVQLPCSVFVQNGDTVSIYFNSDDKSTQLTTNTLSNNVLLTDGGNGEVAPAIMDKIDESALWVVKMTDQEAVKSGYTDANKENYYGKHGKEYAIALQSVTSKKWLRISDNRNALILTDAEDNCTLFSHEHSYTAYDWEKNYVTICRLFFCSSTKYYYMVYNVSAKKWEVSTAKSNATVRFVKWTKCDEKVATVEAALNENDSRVSKDEADKRNFYYFPFACWKTGGIAGSALEKATDLGLMDKYSQRYATGYEEQKAVYTLTPTVAHRVYYRCLATDTINGAHPNTNKPSGRAYDFLLKGKTISLKYTELPDEAANVTFSAQWSTNGANPNDPTYSRLTTDMVKDRNYMETDRKPNLSLCGFDETTINQYIETAPRNMMQYAIDNRTLTIKPVSVSPWNVYATKEDGKTKGWYYYLDTLTVSTTASGCKSQSVRLPIGRESFHIAYECQPEFHISAVKGDNAQSYNGGETFFNENGGDWKIEFDSLTIFRGIGFMDMDVQEKTDDGYGRPLLFRANTGKFTRYVIDNEKGNGKKFNYLWGSERNVHRVKV